MSLIKLSDNYSILAEGEYIFNVKSVNYDENFGKLVINLTTEKGENAVERYNLLTQSGQPNETAMKVFSFFARICLNNKDITEVDPDMLVGCFFKGKVQHEIVESNKEPGKTMTFVKIVDKEPSDGWATKKQEPSKVTTSKTIDDSLDDLLN